MKSLSKNTNFIKEMLVTDAVTGKCIEEAQPLKLQPAQVKNKSIFTPKKLQPASISEKKNQF